MRRQVKLTEKGQRALGYSPGSPHYQAFMDGIDMGRAYKRQLADQLAEALMSAAQVAHRSQHDINTFWVDCRLGDHPGTGTRCGEWAAILAAYKEARK